jgi:transcription elongation factor S-II
LGRTGDGTRNKIQQLLFDALGGSAGEWEVELAVRMERSMWSMYGDTSQAYRVKYRELAMNLKDPLNPDINDALLCGAWTPEQVVSMSVKELASQSLKAQREAEAKWARDEARSDLGKLNGLTDMFRCGKCRERKCTYYQMQTRSADEPMTVFVRCTVCGNRWKM